jgi:hypothetical protein
MKCAAVAAFVLLFAAGASAQRRHPAPSAPPAPFVPQTLSTGGITTLPPPPPPSPFAARPETFAPQFDRTSPFRPGNGPGVSIYNGTLGFSPYFVAPEPAAPPPAPDQQRPPAARAPESPAAPEPPRIPEPLPEPPRVAVSHGPDTFYVIPGCYAGNRPPDPERLPKGCDKSRLRTTPVR